MKPAHLAASELFLVLLLAGCANLPMDQACRAGIESEVKLLIADDNQVRYHRSPDFVFLLSEAEDNELAGNYRSCLNNLKMAKSHSHDNAQNTYSLGEQIPSYQEPPPRPPFVDQ